MKCTICNCEKSELICELDCGNLDDSKLYRFVKVVCCDNCGHIYNDLTVSETNHLVEYYNKEYAALSVFNRARNSVASGQDNQLLDLVSGHLKKDTRILNIKGCTYDFLNLINSKGTFIFKDNSFDVVVLDQIIEHFIDVRKLIREVKRILVDDGFFCVSVPDAAQYENSKFFDLYWLLIREHVQHFDIKHLKMLVESEGFATVKSVQNEIPIMSKKMMMPNLNVVFYLNHRKQEFALKSKMKKYKYKQSWNYKRWNTLYSLCFLRKPIYVWGIGKEFLHLYETTELKYCNIVALIDDIKQGHSVDACAIMSSDKLKDAHPNSVLLITATAHVDLLKKKALEIGFKGEIINV